MMLFVLMLGTLIAVGAAVDKTYNHEHSFDGGDHQKYEGHHLNNDWLNPGGVVYSHNWGTPAYYTWYPTYTYPTYHYTALVVYPTYNPFVYNYDPWWATNVYGWSGATYHYSNSWGWSAHHDGLFF